MFDFAFNFLAIACALLVVAAIWVLMSYNRMRQLEARCTQARNDIDVQLKQRADLLPNLVTVVKGFVHQENHLLDVLKDIQTLAYAGPSAGIHNNGESNSNITNSLSSVFASLDSIPELTSSQHYADLRHHIKDCEERISASRRFLNLATAEYTAKCMQFPANLFARSTSVSTQKGYSLGADRVFHEDAPTISL